MYCVREIEILLSRPQFAFILDHLNHCASEYVANVTLENSRMPTCSILQNVRIERNPIVITDKNIVFV
ncbi:hypothetical protein DOY81_004229 [Sarcophaga bullata]|nr:hypothetical protein DOY81_004229 [Sarcophaga bullata]